MTGEGPVWTEEKLPKLVMFDLDGTLIDSVPGLARAVDRVLVHMHHAPVGIDNVRNWVGNGSRMLMRRALAGAIEPREGDERETDAALALFMTVYADCHGRDTVYPGVRETLNWLREHAVNLALITNKPQQFIPPILQEMDLDGYFRWMIGGDSLPQQKPDPAALVYVMAQAEVSPVQACFVGDSRNDVLAAKAAGVYCVGVDYGYNHGRSIREEGADRVVSDLRQLFPCTG